MVEWDKRQLEHKETGRGQPFQRRLLLEWHSFIVKSRDIALVLPLEYTAPASSGMAYLFAVADISTTVCLGPRFNNVQWGDGKVLSRTPYWTGVHVQSLESLSKWKSHKMNSVHWSGLGKGYPFKVNRVRVTHKPCIVCCVLLFWVLPFKFAPVFCGLLWRRPCGLEGNDSVKSNFWLERPREQSWNGEDFSPQLWQSAIPSRHLKLYLRIPLHDVSQYYIL